MDAMALAGRIPFSKAIADRTGDVLPLAPKLPVTYKISREI